MKVLLIDDSPMQQKIARIYLEKGEGYTVLTANNGKDGVEAAKAEKPDLILLDVEMPELNGEEALKILKEGDDTKEIPVIMCTGANGFVEDHFINLGAVAYIRKPHGFSSLRNKLKEIFSDN